MSELTKQILATKGMLTRRGYLATLARASSLLEALIENTRRATDSTGPSLGQHRRPVPDHRRDSGDGRDQRAA